MVRPGPTPDRLRQQELKPRAVSFTVPYFPSVCLKVASAARRRSRASASRRSSSLASRLRSRARLIFAASPSSARSATHRADARPLAALSRNMLFAVSASRSANSTSALFAIKVAAQFCYFPCAESLFVPLLAMLRRAAEYPRGASVMLFA